MRVVLLLLLVLLPYLSRGNSILIPMDEGQRNHLKAYGIAYFVLQHDINLDWLLNYRGGSFLVIWSKQIQEECLVRGVTHEVLSDAETNKILQEISSPAVNMNAVRLETAPRIAVYSPKNDFILDETDAVMLVLDYAEIPYKIIYDVEVLEDALLKFDWLHLHHEDFTGQFGRHMRRNSSRMEADIQELNAQRMGYKKVSEMKLAVAKRIKAFCAAGGYLFAM
ncbi:MAG: asparagine synthetase B, partial [Cyclobacteriaceae bacterium]